MRYNQAIHRNKRYIIYYDSKYHFAFKINKWRIWFYKINDSIDIYEQYADINHLFSHLLLLIWTYFYSQWYLNLNKQNNWRRRNSTKTKDVWNVKGTWHKKLNENLLRLSGPEAFYYILLFANWKQLHWRKCIFGINTHVEEILNSFFANHWKKKNSDVLCYNFFPSERIVKANFCRMNFFYKRGLGKQMQNYI